MSISLLFALCAVVVVVDSFSTITPYRKFSTLALLPSHNNPSTRCSLRRGHIPPCISTTQIGATTVTQASSTSNSASSFSFLVNITPKLAVFEEIIEEGDSGHGRLVTLSVRATDKSTDSSANPLAAGKELISCSIHQDANGPVPRSYLPSLLTIATTTALDSENGVDLKSIQAALPGLVEEALRWYSDAGGRIAHLDLLAPTEFSSPLLDMGFAHDNELQAADMQDERDKLKQRVTAEYASIALGRSHSIFRSTALKLRPHCLKRLEDCAVEVEVASAAATTTAEGKIHDVDSTSYHGNAYTLNDLIGRLSHDAGEPREAIQYYTAALTVKPESAAAFRNLGSAYAAAGDMQMAFASYQQAIQLDQSDALVYLKLAFFYEGFAAQDWPEAETHAQRCYNYYLDNVDGNDTAILTRLANLLTTETDAAAAVAVYDRILKLDDSLVTAWFNRAHAQIKSRDYSGAKDSLQRALALDDSLVAARHMLTALDEEQAVQATTADAAYVKQLFNAYAPTYDKQIKKLLYAAPRVIRQELAKIYQSRYSTRAPDGTYVIDTKKIQALQQQRNTQEQSGEQQVDAGGSNPHGCDSDTDTDFVDAAAVAATATTAVSGAGVSTEWTGADADTEAEIAAVIAEEAAQLVAPTSNIETTSGIGSSCTSYTSFMNHSLDVLDLGCGTGMAGSWLKDYAATLTGVDMSTEMIAVARKKGIYQSLHEMSLIQYFQHRKAELQQRSQQAIDVVRGGPGTTVSDFDVVVAAEVLSYVGNLKKVFTEVASVMRSQALFAFTVEASDSDAGGAAPAGFRLLKSGRFGYTKSYVDSIVYELGSSFKVILCREFSPRLDMGEPVPGYLYIVQKE